MDNHIISHTTSLFLKSYDLPVPQEEGNIPYVIDNKVGAFETRPPFIGGILRQWLDPANKTDLQAMAARSKALGRQEGDDSCSAGGSLGNLGLNTIRCLWANFELC